jgi:hypothetical protein
MESLFDAVLDNEGTEGTKGECKRIYSHGLHGNNFPPSFSRFTTTLTVEGITRMAATKGCHANPTTP